MKRYSKYLVPLFVIFEMISILAAGFLGLAIPRGMSSLASPIYSIVVLITMISWPLSAGILGYYRDRRTWNIARSFIQLTLQWFFISSILFTTLVLTKSDISRLSLGLFLCFGYILLFLANRIRFVFLRSIRSIGMNQRIIAFIGSGADYERFSNWLKRNPSFGYILVYHVEIAISDAMLNPIMALENYLKNTVLDEIIIGSFEYRRSILIELVDIAEERGCRVRIIQEKEDVYTRQMGLTPFGPFQVISVREEPLSNPPAKLIKRMADIIFSGLVIIFLYWWMHLILGLFIKRSSPGPVLFKQKRVGKNGREFYCYKFRTMAPNGSNCEGQGEITKKQDSRITPIGSFMRKTNLDEFPQFINVFVGDMSVVGPRPHMLQEDYEVAKKLKKYRIRRFVRPGITGWAQVNGYRGGTEDMSLMQKRVDYDIEYIETWTAWLDWKIVYMTVVQMLTGRTGAH